MTPLGLATLGREPVLVGARLIRRSGGEVLLGDALATVQARDAADSGACAPGDFVEAALALDPTTGTPSCTHLRRLGGGRASAELRSPLPLLLRQAADRAVRDFFGRESFLEVHAPTFGMCPGLDPHVQAWATAPGVRGPEWSMTSPEFYLKRLLAQGFPRVFQLASVFRAEELGPWHEPEFTLLEWYRAYEDLEAVMTDTERLVCAIDETLRATGVSALHTFELHRPFARLTVREVFRKYAGIADASDYAASDPAAYFQTFVDSVEPRLAEMREAIFLTEFPASQAALARLAPEDPKVALRFELLIGGVEICNGYDELTDVDEQRSRFELELARRRRSGEPQYPLPERFLAALDDGMPPAAGNALGVERLLAVLTGAPGIGSFYAFPASEH